MKIYDDNRGFEIHVDEYRHQTKKTLSFWFIIVENGEASEPYIISRNKIIRSNFSLDFLRDYSVNIDKLTIEQIEEKFKSVMQNLDNNILIDGDKAKFSEVYDALVSYIGKYEENTLQSSPRTIYIENGYGFILTNYMDEAISELKSYGYKRLELLKALRINNKLDISAGRPYDYGVNFNKKTEHYYKIILEEKVTNKVGSDNERGEDISAA